MPSMLTRRGALLLGAAGIAGCGRSTAGYPTVIRFSFWGMTQEAKVWQEIADRFHARQKHIRVKLEHITGQSYHPKLFAMTVGNCAPDVMATDDEPFRFLSDNGVYEDLTPFLSGDPALGRDVFYTAPYDTYTVGSRQYALPYIALSFLIYYNRDHRRAAGLPPDPDPNWTWDDFDRDAIALTRDLDGDGRTDQFGFNRLSWYHCLQWIWDAGGTDMDPGMTRYIFDSPEGRRGFQFHYDQMHVHRVCPLVSDLPNMNTESTFLTGKVSMFMYGAWWLVQCRQSKTIDWDIAAMPIGPVKRSTRCTTEGLAISTQSKFKAQGWEWIKFVLGDEGQAVFAKYGRGVPSVRRVAAATFPDPNTPQHEERFMEALDNYSMTAHLHARWTETEQVFNREWDRVAMKLSTVDDFLRASLPEANAIVRGDNL